MKPADFEEMVKLDLVGYYTDRYPAIPSVLESFCEVDTLDASLGDYESATVVSGLGDPEQVNRGEVPVRDEIRETFTWYLAVKPYRLALTYQEDMKDWPKWRIEARLEKDGLEIARVFNRKENKLAADVFNHGALTDGDADVFSGTPPSRGQTDPYPKFIYDGKPFFADDHPLSLDASQTFINWLTGTDLDYAGLEVMELLIKNANAYNERGQKISLSPDSIMIPDVLSRQAQQLLESQNESSKDFGDTNVFRGVYNVIVNPYLDGTAAATAQWFMGMAKKGVTFSRQGDISINVEYDGKKREWNVDIMKIFGVTVKNWRYWAASKTLQS